MSNTSPSINRRSKQNNRLLQYPKENSIVKGEPEPFAALVYVEKLLSKALFRRASDIHLESTLKEMRIRFRIDGMLSDMGWIRLDNGRSVISRLKIMAGLDITERRFPQDGRFRIEQDSKPVDLRVSTIPSLYGEKVVLRILDLETTSIPIAKVGLSEHQIQELREVLGQFQGLILLTGPTGSGKSSTTYACLNEINAEHINITTIEDPIEYQMEGVTQIAVKEHLTFDACLRAVLRQDPDAIVVGEIRDIETARITMQAALTGHMVLASLHTHDAIGAINRLQQMEIPPYLISDAVNCVVAQRLLRVLCEACKTPWKPDHTTRKMLGLEHDESVVLYRARGCPECYGSGAVGRTGIFEILSVTRDIQDSINRRASEEKLRDQARTEGMTTMFQSGVRKVLEGIVAYEELLRVTQPRAGERNCQGSTSVKHPHAETN